MAKPSKPAAKPQPVIVSAVGICCAPLDPANAESAKQIELAMSQAVTDCLARGVSIEDSVTIKAAMMDAMRTTRAELGLPE